MKEGKGKLTFANGAKYEGQFVANRIEGHGTFTWSSSDKKTYIGDWLDGKMQGTGCMMFEDGSCYEGGFKNHKREGVGKFTFASGAIYDGEWLDGH